jgi:hypothetical protein
MFPDELLKSGGVGGMGSTGEYQGWHFIIVKNKDHQEMADSLQSVIDKVAWPEAQAWPEEINRYRKNGAPSS